MTQAGFLDQLQRLRSRHANELPILTQYKTNWQAFSDKCRCIGMEPKLDNSGAPFRRHFDTVPTRDASAALVKSTIKELTRRFTSSHPAAPTASQEVSVA
jgi:hypothetical protein